MAGNKSGLVQITRIFCGLMTYVPNVACRQVCADVAELVDALVSGISDSNVMGVQVSPSALSLVKTNKFLR